MSGAGHNYGIVKKFKYRIFDYPRGQDTYCVTYTYTEDKLEHLSRRLNKLLGNGTLAKDAMMYTIFPANPDNARKVD